MRLTHANRRELRDLGWSVGQRKADRPEAIPATDILHIDEHVAIDEAARERLLAGLDERR